MKNSKTILLFSMLGLFIPTAANAIPLTLGGPLPGAREATLDSAIAGSGVTGSGNAGETEVDAAYGGSWTDVGHVDPGAGTSQGLLTITFANGAFGDKVADGTWTVDSSFLSLYSELAISIHVGNGGGIEPDHFIWRVDLTDDILVSGVIDGTWAVDGGTLAGGGFSNLVIYGRGPGTSVPDGGATLALFGLGLLGVGAVRKFVGKSEA